MTKRQGKIRIGISGWTYPPWRGVYFPEKLPQKRELEYAAHNFASIEINGSFYSLQRPSSYQAWYEAASRGFVFAVKGSRFITHLRRLKEIRAPLANFFASGVLCLKEKLGPLLWQFPPNFRYDRDRLVEFFKLLPRDTASAAKLARKHDARLKGRAWTSTDRNRRLRHAMEVRHPSFETREFIELLREHWVGFVVADTAGKWPYLEDVTSDFIYVRLHGDEKLYRSGYTDKALDAWAKKVRAWAGGRTPASTKRIGPLPRTAKKRDVYVYFDNDAKVHAPFDAMALAHRLRLGPTPPPGP
jgi:uncharacterized protein YecE (DUF72 family)